MRISPDGEVVARAEESYPLSTPQPGWAEQDPEDWWRATEAALAQVEQELPRPGVAFEALLPFDRGDLLNRIHTSGDIEHLEHTGDGTVVRGRVHEDLAGELTPYLTHA